MNVQAEDWLPEGIRRWFSTMLSSWVSKVCSEQSGQYFKLSDVTLEFRGDRKRRSIQMALTSEPTGPDLSRKADQSLLDTASTATGEVQGKKVRFTPVNPHHITSEQALENGQFIGVLENEIAGDKSGLQPGKYNVHIAKVGTQWHVYAESSGKIAAKAASVVERRDTPANQKPQFSTGSFCWWVWLGFTGFTWCF